MSTNAFDVLMRKVRPPVCPPDDPRVTAVIYEAHLEHVDPEEPMFRVPYFGQVVRAGTAEENFEARKREHLRYAAREDKDLGFHAVIGMFGPDAFEWRIVVSESGPRTAMQTWADVEEKRLIAEHGGPLRDMDVASIRQTLNLTEGGQWGDAVAWWVGMDAWRMRKLNRFKVAMEVYVAEFKDALVPSKFVDGNDYPLGARLSAFRQGAMWKGMSEEATIIAWAEALPKFAWNAQKTDEHREAISRRNKDWYANASVQAKAERVRKCKATMDAKTDEEKVEIKRNVKETKDAKTDEEKAEIKRKRKATMDAKTDEEKAEIKRKKAATISTDASKAKRSKNATNQWANASEETRIKWMANNSAARRRPEVRARSIKAGKEQAANETLEQKAGRIAKTRATMATDASKAKRSKITIHQRKIERFAELTHARQIAVPFVKSKNRRIEMRAASKEMRAASINFSGRKGKSVLYMVSEDGKTIRRVQTNGMMCERDIVGPVVDPAPLDAFDSD